jgi:3-methyladenine DNA glycosylase AlkC
MASNEVPRKGAARIALIPPPVLEALNRGELATANLNEFLALDLPALTRAVAQAIGLDPDSERIADTLAMLPAFKPVARHQHVARALYDLASLHGERDAIAHALATHPSDVARTWAAQWVGFSGLSLPDKLASVRRFATDPHFGVRETAWMAVRDEVVRDSVGAIGLLRPWVADTDANIRRFASELTRPRGVWCAPVPALKREPWLALDLLEPLKADDSRYVQNSVANWLNDASKSQPRWVEEVCDRWSAESPGLTTAYIVRRAMRTLRAPPSKTNSR